MGMFTENNSGNRCSDCTWADKMEDKVKKLTSDNIDHAKLLDKMECFAKDCSAVGNLKDAKEVRSWIKQLRIVVNVVRHNQN